MKIEKIRIQNFYSFKDTLLKVGDYSGLTLIKGKNRDTGGSNGSGKSALVEALYFGLTGKTIRKSTEDSLVNNQAKKKCLVEVYIVHNNKKVIIRRQKKPTKLEFLVGKEDRTKDTVAATQSEIDSHLNINHKVLLASMFFGQSNDVNFLDCSADDKRTIIRNFLNLDDIFQMRDKIKTHKSTFYQGIKEKDAVINETNKNTAKIDLKIAEVAKAKTQFAEYDKDILNLSLQDILEAEEMESSRQRHEMSIGKQVASLDEQIATLRLAIKAPTNKKCEKCGQPVKKEMNKSLLEEELLILEKERVLFLNSWEGVKEEKTPIPVSSKEFSKVLEYKELCRDETNYSDIKEDMLSSIAEAQEIKDSNKTWYEVMRFWEKAFSEQGVIKHIINNILDYFNERCNFYLSYLTNSKYFVEFDQELNEKIETNKRLLSYISLSGGEKRKLNLAIMLGLKDLLLLTDKSHVDLIFFDEVAENIDEEGIQGLYQLLLEIKKNKTIFVITHNKYLKTLLDSSRRLSIIKHKGISQIKN